MKRVFEVLGFFVVGFFLQNSSYAQPSITVDMPDCNKERVLYQGETFDQCFVYGIGLATAVNASVSGPSVTAQIISKSPLANGKEDKIQLKFTAGPGATTGQRKVTIHGPQAITGKAWNASFAVNVKPKATLTGGSLTSNLEGSFKDNVDVLLNGANLANIKKVEAELVPPVFDQNGSQVSPYTAGPVQAAINNSTPNTSQQVLVRFNFGSPLSEASVKVKLMGDPNSACDAMRAHSVEATALQSTISIKAQPATQNYVTGHIFDRNDRKYKTQDVVTVTVRLSKAASSKGETLYWALLPSDDFSQAGPTGTPYNSNAARNMVTVPAGSINVIITFQVASCSGNSSYTAKFITWKPDPYDDTTPNRMESNFTVNCEN
jgi:hypothetical protein